jgi:hypothetical protein
LDAAPQRKRRRHCFRARQPEDYRVSILEVAGSLTTDIEIAAMDVRWKHWLQSKEMGLNQN